MENRKCIFITGAGSGIGRATALHFAKKGWFVGLLDLSETPLSSLAAEVGREKCFCQVMDVTKPESVRDAVSAFCGQTGGRMDVLFNCAGVLSMGGHHRIPLADQKKIVDVNFTGILNCIHFCFDSLRDTPSSRIINMSSASSVYGTPELAVYSATKFAVSGLTEALNIEFEQFGIHVCDVLAPYVRTPMIVDSKVQASSVGRLGIRLQPDHVAAVVWKAANGKRVHWYVSWMLSVLVFLSWAFPFGSRTLVKLLAFSPER